MQHALVKSCSSKFLQYYSLTGWRSLQIHLSEWCSSTQSCGPVHVSAFHGAAFKPDSSESCRISSPPNYWPKHSLWARVFGPASRWLCRSLGDPQQCAWRGHARESWQAVDGQLWKPKSRKFSQIMLLCRWHHGQLMLCSKVVSKMVPWLPWRKASLRWSLRSPEWRTKLPWRRCKRGGSCEGGSIVGSEMVERIESSDWSMAEVQDSEPFGSHAVVVPCGTSWTFHRQLIVVEHVFQSKSESHCSLETNFGSGRKCCRAGPRGHDSRPGSAYNILQLIRTFPNVSQPNRDISRCFWDAVFASDWQPP